MPPTPFFPFPAECFKIHLSRDPIRLPFLFLFQPLLLPTTLDFAAPAPGSNYQKREKKKKGNEGVGSCWRFSVPTPYSLLYDVHLQC